MRFILICLLLTACALKKDSQQNEFNTLIVDTVNVDTINIQNYQPNYFEESYSLRYESQPYLEVENNKTNNVDVKIIEVPSYKTNDIEKSGGYIVYKIPTEMLVRNTYQVIVRISKSKINIYENINGVIKTSTIPITETMEVRLIDSSPSDNKMFDIGSNNKLIQLVENNENITQWTFDVTPIRIGKSKLKVVISTITNGKVKETVYEDEVKVKINITKTIPFFIGKYWQWLLSTIIIPLIIWRYKKRQKNQ